MKNILTSLSLFLFIFTTESFSKIEIKIIIICHSSKMFANGINNRADLTEISLIRLRGGTIRKIPINNQIEFNNILSNDKDKIIVRNFPYRSVEIKGAVKNPGKYLVKLFVTAKNAGCGPPYHNGTPNLWALPKAISAPTETT